MRNLLILVFISSLPFLIMIVVNETSETPSHKPHSECCTRYCHDHGCRHKPAGSIFQPLYTATIHALAFNGYGATYGAANILLFVILWPGLMVVLLWLVLRNSSRIRKLKKGR